MMSARSKSSDSAVDRPFDRKVLARARALAERYEIVLAFEDGEWYGHGLEMPTVFGEGRTPDRCVEHTREALTAAIATMLEADESPPAPARRGVRSEQVNVRLTPEEKALLETSARQKGFRGLSDFLRTTALTEAK